MASTGLQAQGGRIMVNLFDGTRQPIPEGTQTLLTIRDGNQNQLSRDFHKSSSVFFTGLPIYNNFGDYYAVLAASDNCKDAGFYPVHVAPNVDQIVDLMLIPQRNRFNFHDAGWQQLGAARPSLQLLLSKGAGDADAAEQRYGDLEEADEGLPLACLLNITTAMAQIQLPQGSPLQYLKQIVWDTIAQDRFFAFADPALITQVKQAVVQHTFVPAPDILHPGATSSFKQVQFGEANLQLTFHENDRTEIDGQTCVLVEPDIDYYKDPGAHFILEVLVNGFGDLTDPRVVYVLRWIAGRRSGIPEFDPLYTIVAD
jgi:hypothetical protein